MQLNEMSSKTWLEISETALVHNLKFFRKLVGKNTKILCVLKANAYGHGMKEIARILSREKDAEWFGVDNLNEAMIIRRLSITKPILIMGYTRLSDLREAIYNRISFVVYNWETLKKIVALGLKKTALIHLKIETGLNRQGIRKAELSWAMNFIKKNKKYLFLQGVYTHFADPADKQFTYKQQSEFNKIIKEIRTTTDNFPILHDSATLATYLYPLCRLGMIRLGIGLYGIWPSGGVQNNKLREVLSWKTIVSQIKYIPEGESVAYGRTWVAKKNTKIAVIPVGYSDGIDRGFSNNGRVLIKGESSSILGRVMMNMIVVDVTSVKNIKLEDGVTIIGKNGGEIITVNELATKLGTINYEVLARINPLLPRVVV